MHFVQDFCLIAVKIDFIRLKFCTNYNIPSKRCPIPPILLYKMQHWLGAKSGVTMNAGGISILLGGSLCTWGCYIMQLPSISQT